MRLTALDRLAAGGTSWLHRASAPSKWIVLAAAISVAIVSRTPWPVYAAYGTLALAAASCRLPLRLLVLASLLPVPLVGLFALSQWGGDPLILVAIIGKGMLTAFGGLLLAATTTYPDLLAPWTRVLPPVIADSLVLTYRAVFILVDRVDSLWRAIRVRGGFGGRVSPGTLPWPARGASLRRRLEVGASGIGLAVLRSADLSVRLYDVMRLRGYAGRLAPTRSGRLSIVDWKPLALAALLVAIGGAARAAAP